ncbi:MAG: aminotransferase class V-fold PLP-dependent enzyme [Bacteroidales bacterium]|jgi:selenocysteine lyase/cysteine desulfurase|nr:aminotransferase class V-fold PLP-dependent enzyme [Bacteroidales bacterium]MCU0410757.1 aminotransferase class V-fold PLP-dependent enzyme [Bacteroidales bacterium]
MSSEEKHFERFRRNIIGIDQEYSTPYGLKKIIYCDWIASGRLYKPIEDKISEEFGPFVANTHTETSETGSVMTWAYHQAQEIIKKHVNAGHDDVLIATGAGMTAVINKFQRILGLKGCSLPKGDRCQNDDNRPVVFITHIEHHSNQTSWYETLADVVIIEPGKDLTIDVENLRAALEKYKNRKFKIGSFSACSNVTGIFTPYHQMARIMHENGGLCFVDFAASAPYVDIDMHPADAMEKLDAIFFSPHKFLGGPGSAGVLLFDKSLYKTSVPDQPGGGTVDWTNPWGEYKYVDSIESREDGGTPGFLQVIRAALAINLKQMMGTDRIRAREEELLKKAFAGLEAIGGLHILAPGIKKRLGVISFYIDDMHYNLVVKLLSDRYGVQVRGGCACAGTYGHYLLDVTYDHSHRITEMINRGDLSEKPGWVRLSLHPTMTDNELDEVIMALKEIKAQGESWSRDYNYNRRTNEYRHRLDDGSSRLNVESWFNLRG